MEEEELLLGDGAASGSVGGLPTPGGASFQGFLQKGRKKLHENASGIEMSSAAQGERDKADSGLQVSQVGPWGPHAGTVFETE